MESLDRSAIDEGRPNQSANVSIADDSGTRRNERQSVDEEKLMQAYALYLERRRAASRQRGHRSTT
jgi:hypothetical protein